MNPKRKSKMFKITVLWMVILSSIWSSSGCIRKKPEITGEKNAEVQLLSRQRNSGRIKNMDGTGKKASVYAGIYGK